MNKVELLAPAGNLECLKAAINNGADAVYIGGEDFSARSYADNFSNEEIIEAINYAHIRGVKVYVGINTLIYDDELDKVFEFVDFLYLNDVDALIVADFGLINALKQRYPKLPIHVSTQMNTHSLWQVKLLESLKVERIVLSRETSLSTIKYIIKNSAVDVEVFVHGALCVCYSGNCLHSSLIGKRSGNRGKCAQPCRMEYSLLENDKAITKKKYLLSTKDLNTLENINEIIASGVSSLKIEGRMKNKEYVAVVVKSYRDAIDAYYDNVKIDNYDALEKMRLVFSRGFTKGYIFNEKNKELSNTYRPSHLGVKVGKVVNVLNDRIQIKLTEDLSQKDKIAIVQEKFDDIKLFISKIFVKNKLVPKGYKDEIIEIPLSSRVNKDASIYKIVDNALMEEINNTYLKNVKRVPIRMKFISNVGEAMTLIVKDYNNHSILVKSDYIVEKAIQSPTLANKINEQLVKLTSSAYTINEINILSDNQGIIPVKYINDLRREAIEKLDNVRKITHNRDVNDIEQINDYIVDFKNEYNKLKVKVHTLHQLDAIAELDGINAIYYDDLNTFKIAKDKYPRLNLVPVLSRINNDRRNIDIDSSVYVVNNYGDLNKFENSRLITDLYMNVANKYTISSLCKYNVESITLSCELNRNQIRDLIDDLRNDYDTLPPLEMVVYGHYQSMITKYCFIAKELGFENKHCGSCKNNKFSLLDRMNYVFPITTDEDCNVTIYNSKAVHLLQFVDEIYDLGISSIRLDFSVENPQEVYEITKAYIDAINGEYSNLDIKDVTYGYYLEDEKN